MEHTDSTRHPRVGVSVHSHCPAGTTRNCKEHSESSLQSSSVSPGAGGREETWQWVCHGFMVKEQNRQLKAAGGGPAAPHGWRHAHSQPVQGCTAHVALKQEPSTISRQSKQPKKCS